MSGKSRIDRSDGRLCGDRLAVAVKQGPNGFQIGQIGTIVLPSDHHVAIPANGHSEAFGFTIVDGIGGVDIHSLAHGADTVVLWLSWKRLAVNLTGQQGGGQEW